MHGIRICEKLSFAPAGYLSCAYGRPRRRRVPRLTVGTPFSPVLRQLPKIEIPAVRGTPTPQVKAEARVAAARLRRLEREYWNIVDGSLEEAEVSLLSTLVYACTQKVHRG